MVQNENLPGQPPLPPYDGQPYGPGAYVIDQPHVFAGSPVLFVRTPSVVFNPPSGTAAPCAVALSVPGYPQALIFYTLDGSTPNSNSRPYWKNTPIDVQSTTEIQAVAFSPGLTMSVIGRAFYPLSNELPPVVFSPREGTTPISVSLSCPGHPDAAIRYTLNGSVPTHASSTYSAPLSLTGNVEIKAIAFKSGFTDSEVSSAFYTPTRLPAVAVTPLSGTLPLSIFLSVPGHPDANVFYVLDNGPVQLYSGDFQISSPTVLYTYATKVGYGQSPVTRVEYGQKLPNVEFATLTGSNEVPTGVSMEVPGYGDAKIYYTTDGSTPTVLSLLYDGNFPPFFPVIKTIKAIGVLIGYANSDVSTYQLVDPVDIPAVQFSPASGATVPFSGAIITLSVGLIGATIRYTTDGSPPTSSSPIYSSPLSGAATIKAKAFKNSDSGPVSTATYNQSQVADVVISPNGGAIPVSVGLTCPTAGASILYSIDGSAPSLPYSNSLSINSQVTLKAVATKSGYLDSSVASADFGNVNQVLPVVFSPISGTPVPLPGSLQITLTCATAGASIYYSTNPAEISAPSTLYAAPITINGTSTFRAQARKLGMTDSEITSASYLQPPDDFAFFFLDKTSDKAGPWGQFSPGQNLDFHFALYFDFPVATEIKRIFVSIMDRREIINAQAGGGQILLTTNAPWVGGGDPTRFDVEGVTGMSSANGYEQSFTRLLNTFDQFKIAVAANGAWTGGGHIYFGGYTLATVNAGNSQAWATYSVTGLLSPVWYPLVVFNGLTQVNTQYGNSLGTFSGFVRLDCYGDIVTIPSNWFKCWVELGNGTVLRRYIQFS
jgi:hypothetical protein